MCFICRRTSCASECLVLWAVQNWYQNQFWLTSWQLMAIFLYSDIWQSYVVISLQQQCATVTKMLQTSVVVVRSFYYAITTFRRTHFVSYQLLYRSGWEHGDSGIMKSQDTQGWRKALNQFNVSYTTQQWALLATVHDLDVAEHAETSNRTKCQLKINTVLNNPAQQ